MGAVGQPCCAEPATPRRSAQDKALGRDAPHPHTHAHTPGQDTSSPDPDAPGAVGQRQPLMDLDGGVGQRPQRHNVSHLEAHLRWRLGEARDGWAHGREDCEWTRTGRGVVEGAQRMVPNHLQSHTPTQHATQRMSNPCSSPVAAAESSSKARPPPRVRPTRSEGVRTERKQGALAHPPAAAALLCPAQRQGRRPGPQQAPRG